MGFICGAGAGAGGGVFGDVFAGEATVKKDTTDGRGVARIRTDKGEIQGSFAVLRMTYGLVGPVCMYPCESVSIRGCFALAGDEFVGVDDELGIGSGA